MAEVKVASASHLQVLLKELRRDMKVEVGPGVNLAPTTVGELQKLATLPQSPLRVTLPENPELFDSCVRIEAAQAPSS